MNYLSPLHNKDFGLLLIRITLALVFIYHGWDKVMNIEGTINFFRAIGLAGFIVPTSDFLNFKGPGATTEIIFWPYIVAYVELLGGILILLGIRVREVALLFVITMIIAIWKVHMNDGFKGMEFQLTLLLASLAILFTGAGKYGLLPEKTNTCGPCEKEGCKC